MAVGALSNDQARQTLAQILDSSEFTQARLFGQLEDFIRHLFENVNLTGIHGNIGGIGRLLMVLIVLAGLILIIYLVRKVAPFWRIMVQDVQDATVSELAYLRPTPGNLLMEAEKKALKDDFRGALRDMYLSILLEMDNRQWIAYEAAKTNSEYLREISQKAADLEEPFRAMMNLFEYKWYGLEACAREDFQKGRELYATLLKGGSHG
jgi:Domain of unknown function (DUF4129)